MNRLPCSDLNILALVKGAERYVFLFHDADRKELLRLLGRYATNPELNFSWHDAAFLSQKVRCCDPECGEGGTK